MIIRWIAPDDAGSPHNRLLGIDQAVRHVNLFTRALELRYAELDWPHMQDSIHCAQR